MKWCGWDGGWRGAEGYEGGEGGYLISILGAGKGRVCESNASRELTDSGMENYSIQAD